MKTNPVCALVFLAMTALAPAEVTRVEVTRRVDLGTTGYEKITGTVRFSVDPKNPRNRVIADLDKAPTAADGRVEFSSDLSISATQGSTDRKRRGAARGGESRPEGIGAGFQSWRRRRSGNGDGRG